MAAEQEGDQLDLPGTGENAEGEKTEAKPSVDPADFEALKAQLSAGREELAELRGRLEEASRRPAQPAEAAPRDLTRAELREMVDRGDISEDQMLDRLEEQREKRLLAQMDQRLEAREAQRQGANLLEEEFAKYDAKIEGLRQQGHPNRQKVQTEYKRLVRAGFPANEQTEIAALARVFGPAERVAERRSTREASQEGGGGGGSETDRPAGSQRYAGLTQGQIEHLEHGKKIGLYRGDDDPALKDYVNRARKRSRGGEARLH